MGYWQNRKVLITGGAGFIGSNLANRLAGLGARIRIVDNLERGSLENLGPIREKVEFWQRDLRDKEVSRQACQGMEVVFHLASKVGGISYYLKNPAQVLRHNILIDSLVLEAALECQVERYLYASSAHVYPLELQTRPDSPPLREESALPAHPSLSYGWAKLLGEKQIEYCLTEGSPLAAAVLRLIGIYGENQDIDLERGSVIPALIRRAIEYPRRRPFTILSSGQEARSFCYIGDALDAMLLAVERLDEHQLIGPINMGSEERVRIRELALEIIRISNKDIEFVTNPSRETTIWAQVPDCSMAKALLGWQCQVPLKEGLKRTYIHIESRLGEGSFH